MLQLHCYQTAYFLSKHAQIFFKYVYMSMSSQECIFFIFGKMFCCLFPSKEQASLLVCGLVSYLVVMSNYQYKPCHYQYKHNGYIIERLLFHKYLQLKVSNLVLQYSNLQVLAHCPNKNQNMATNTTSGHIRWPLSDEVCCWQTCRF